MEVSLCTDKYHVELDGFSPIDAIRSTCAPLLSSGRALSRFEFEAGSRGNDGTKVLMVEWLDEEGDSDWQISWEGKTTVLPTKNISISDKLLRIYFLLSPGASIPRVVKISRVDGKFPQIQINPLPAIFPPELVATTQIRKGVLHTIWAKKRLSALQKEIELEMRNGEGVGLEMALQERQWIQDEFGIFTKAMPELELPITPASIYSPHNGNFPQKLKSLSLSTNGVQVKDLSNYDKCSSHPLSPDSNDIAVSSFPLFNSPCKTAVLPSFRSKPQSQTPNIIDDKKFNSIDAIAESQPTIDEVVEAEDELFALKLSPRSPEMTRSPFCGSL
ncbi:hypothetical protein GcM1_240038 [Golovinomyces cichoracearum]|uniref:Uncharacterized protein n=1 Tax=Golovinomyces cichoracearum TaxID=62708 RepID=A0A420IIA5_9PEZI|nr:hypothetical protein GcM1_240038 [Golovinomyces cichoracearum]